MFGMFVWSTQANKRYSRKHIPTHAHEHKHMHMHAPELSNILIWKYTPCECYILLGTFGVPNHVWALNVPRCACDTGCILRLVPRCPHTVPGDTGLIIGTGCSPDTGFIEGTDNPQWNDVSAVFEKFLWNVGESFCVAGAVFGDVGGCHLLFRAL